MADILIFNTVTGKPLQYLKSAHTPNFKWRADVLVNPNMPDKPLDQLKVVDGVVIELTDEEIAGEHAAAAAQAKLEAFRISYEDMPIKFPALAWALIEEMQPTRDERKALILGLKDFFTFIQAGHVLMAVEELNSQPTPEGVPTIMWEEVKAKVNYVIQLNS